MSCIEVESDRSGIKQYPETKYYDLPERRLGKVDVFDLITLRF
jgi:hypothetical protein